MPETNVIQDNTIVITTLRPRQNGRRFADDTFKRIFLKENVRISNKISLKFVPKSPIDNIPALFQITAWRRPGDKPLCEPMMVSLLTHICVTRPQWVKIASRYLVCRYYVFLWDVYWPKQNRKKIRLFGLCTHCIISDYDECSSNPCLNGGVCNNLVKRYKCDCNNGWEGNRCQWGRYTVVTLTAVQYRISDQTHLKLKSRKRWFVHNIRFNCSINSSPPSATYMRRWTGSASVQIMACCLFDTKPLSNPMLHYCQLDP